MAVSTGAVRKRSRISGLTAKQAFKRAWATQPFNALATRTVKGVVTLAGRDLGRAERYLHHSGTTKARLPNGRTLVLWSGGDEEIANIVFWRGWDGYEPEVSALFYRLAARARTTIDVGAHVGFYSALASLANPGGTVVALEPHPEVFAGLERTLRINELSNVHPIRVAAGSQAGVAELREPRGAALTTMSTLSTDFALHAERYGVRPNRYGVRSIEVRVERLDDLAEREGIERVDLLKIDTETTEDQVLKGSRALLERDRPHIFCELLGTEAAATAQGLLEPLGYRFFLLGPEGAEPQAALVPEPGAGNNYLFSVDEGVLAEISA